MTPRDTAMAKRKTSKGALSGAPDEATALAGIRDQCNRLQRKIEAHHSHNEETAAWLRVANFHLRCSRASHVVDEAMAYLMAAHAKLELAQQAPYTQRRGARIAAGVNGKKTTGVPRPKRRSPLVQALRILVDEGLTNDQIINALGEADSISSRAVNDDFPIEVLEPDTTLRDDGVLRWFPSGDPNATTTCPVGRLKKRLSEIRNSLKNRLSEIRNSA